MMLLFLSHSVTHYNVGLLCGLTSVNRSLNIVAVSQTPTGLEGMDTLCFPRKALRLKSSGRIVFAAARATMAKLADVVHANTALDGLRTKSYDKLVVTEHGRLGFSLVDSDHEYYAREAAALIALSEIGVPVVVASHYNASRLRRLYGVKVSKVIHHGVLESFYSSKPRERVSPKPRLLWSSRFARSKEPEVFVKAIAVLRKHYSYAPLAVMIGKGPLKSYVQRLVREEGLSNLFLLDAKLPFHALPKRYKYFDILVHTSRTEPFGLVVLEAMASGMPVVVPREGGAYEVAGAGAPSYEPGDAGELAARIYELLSSEDAYARAARYSFERAKTFSWRKAAREYMEIYEKLA